MSDIIPTPGRIVWYTLTQRDVDDIVRKRVMFRVGGNTPYVGKIYPAIVVETWNTQSAFGAINLKVQLDGPDDYWAQNVKPGGEPGTYQWMPYQKGQAAKTEEIMKQWPSQVPTPTLAG
jgi:hypothetical protein